MLILLHLQIQFLERRNHLILVLANSYIFIYVLTDTYQYFVSDIFHENIPYAEIIYTYIEP